MKEAEEEESSEEDEDEEENIEVVYDDRVIGTKIEDVPKESPTKEAAPKPVAAEDDIDIDAI